MGRTTGYANGTTNNFYTTSEGFLALDTFRNNSPNYSNNASSFPTLSISFGATSSPIPQAPGPLPLLGLGAALGWSRQLRKRIHAQKR